MKIESTEHAIKLIPETDWEKEQLKRLLVGVESVSLADSWNLQFPLILQLKKHPWHEK